MECQYCNTILLPGETRIMPALASAGTLEFWPDENEHSSVAFELPQPAFRCAECGLLVILHQQRDQDCECFQCKTPASTGTAELSFHWCGGIAAVAATLITQLPIGGGETSLVFTQDGQSIKHQSDGPALYCPKCKTLCLMSELPEYGEAVKCLSCGESIPPDAGKCPACGWSWAETAE